MKIDEWVEETISSRKPLKKRKLSQERLAEIANISTHGLSNIETGKTDLRYTNLLSIAKAFKMRPCELLDFNL